jgi:hypothetical protein
MTAVSAREAADGAARQDPQPGGSLAGNDSRLA